MKPNQPIALVAFATFIAGGFLLTHPRNKSEVSSLRRLLRVKENDLTTADLSVILRDASTDEELLVSIDFVSAYLSTQAARELLRIVLSQ